MFQFGIKLSESPGKPGFDLKGDHSWPTKKNNFHPNSSNNRAKNPK
jgi:hypothetical protein